MAQAAVGALTMPATTISGASTGPSPAGRSAASAMPGSIDAASAAGTSRCLRETDARSPTCMRLSRP